MNRRTALGALATAGVGSLAGCFLLNDTIEESAQPARVGDDALGETGYEHQRTEDAVREETIEAGGESRDVKLTNWISEYSRSLPEADLDAARFGLFASPTVSVAGNDVNPFEQFDDERLVTELVDRVGLGVEDIEKVDDRTVSVLGTDVNFSEFVGTSTEYSVEVRLHLGHLTNDGDFVVCFAGHPDPESLGLEVFEETENINTLAEATEHPTDP